MSDLYEKNKEITINSTDEERTTILSNKSLTVVQWDKKHGFRQTDPQESIAHALGRYMDERNLRGKPMYFKDFSGDVTFTRQTLHESIRQMTKRHGDLANLGRVLSIIDDVCQNAEKIEVEPYRHAQPKTGTGFKQMHQYMSAFHDMDYIYPVKITIREAEGKQANRFYMVITVGMIDIEDKIKEALTNTRVHPEMGESLPAGGASFNINIPQLISCFNKEEGIIIKNLPDGLLNYEQRQIKEKVQKTDIENQSKSRISNYEKSLTANSTQLDATEKPLNRNQTVIKEQTIEHVQKRNPKEENSIRDAKNIHNSHPTKEELNALETFINKYDNEAFLVPIPGTNKAIGFVENSADKIREFIKNNELWATGIGDYADKIVRALSDIAEQNNKHIDIEEDTDIEKDIDGIDPGDDD